MFPFLGFDSGEDSEEDEDVDAVSRWNRGKNYKAISTDDQGETSVLARSANKSSVRFGGVVYSRYPGKPTDTYEQSQNGSQNESHLPGASPAPEAIYNTQEYHDDPNIERRKYRNTRLEYADSDSSVDSEGLPPNAYLQPTKEGGSVEPRPAILRSGGGHSNYRLLAPCRDPLCTNSMLTRQPELAYRARLNTKTVFTDLGFPLWGWHGREAISPS